MDIKKVALKTVKFVGTEAFNSTVSNIERLSNDSRLSGEQQRAFKLLSNEIEIAKKQYELYKQKSPSIKVSSTSLRSDRIELGMSLYIEPYMSMFGNKWLGVDDAGTHLTQDSFSKMSSICNNMNINPFIIICESKTINSSKKIKDQVGLLILSDNGFVHLASGISKYSIVQHIKYEDVLGIELKNSIFDSGNILIESSSKTIKMGLTCSYSKYDREQVVDVLNRFVRYFR